MLQDVNTEEESDADKVFNSRSKCVASCEPFGMSGRLSFADDVLFVIILWFKQPVVTDSASTSKKLDENGSIPRNALVQPTEDHRITKPTKVKLQ